MGARGPALLRSIAALASTIALVLGVPLLLVGVVGNPLPETLPTVDELRILLTQTGDGFTHLIIGTLAVLVWFIWAQLVLALIVEILAVVRHAQTPQLPTMPGIQRLAAGLVAAITLAATLSAAPVLAPSAGALHFDVAPSVQTASLPSTDTDVVDLRDLEVEEPMLSLELSDHTELWDVADAAYGDGMSWKLIAAMNAGRQDASGGIITDDTAAVGPGTVLRLPGVVDERALALHGTIDGPDLVAEVPTRVIAPGDSMWTIAESELQDQLGRPVTQDEVAQYWSELVESNRHVPSGDVDLIYAGDNLVLPEVAGAPVEAVPDLDGVTDGPADNRSGPRRDAAPPDGSAPPDDSAPPDGSAPTSVAPVAPPSSAPSPTVTPPTGSPATASPAVPISLDEEQVERSYVPLGLAGFGAAVLAAGIVGGLRRRRDRQRRIRPAMSMAARPSSTAAAFEAALLQSSSELRESDLGGGWQVMPASVVDAARSAGSLQFHAEESGRLRAITVVDDEDMSEIRQIDFDAQRPVQGEVPREDPHDLVATVAPTSLLIGTACATGDAVFLDLASSGCVSIVGDSVAAQRFARTAVLELALSDRAEDLVVIAVGVAGQLADLERVAAVDTMAEALHAANNSGHASPDSSTPIVVVSARPAGDDIDSWNALKELGACMVGPGMQAPVEISLDGVFATVSPPGSKVELAALKADEYASVVELVNNSAPSAMEPVKQTAPESIETEPGPVEVKVLGAVQVAGAESFSSLKAVDVVAYLAFHRNGADADQIKSWVWPTYEPPTDKAFANVMSRARRGLGVDDDGLPYLSRAGSDRTYRLSPTVTTDFDRFRAIVSQADEAETPAETVSTLSKALELIRGVPFTGGGASSFVWADNHVRAQVEFAIDEAVHRCADLALEADDLDTARWAALKGLELVPGCEQCFRRRFLVAGAGQNRSELRRAMADLERSAAADLGEPEGVDLISGDLLELYNQLDQTLVAGPS